MEDTLINFGSEIKVLGETADAWRVGGWAVVFGTRDASNLKDMFAADTDYDFENGEARSLYYNHGLDGTIKKTRIGRATLELKDAGVWYEGEVKKRTDYLKAHAAKIVEGIKAGIYGTSTGAPAHLVEREKITGGHNVKMWPISEISITPTPAEPLTSCISLKSLVEIEEADELKAATTTASALPYPEQQAAVVDFPTREPVLVDDEADYIRCPACSAHNAPDATKCRVCGAMIPESARKSVEFKKYDPDQPRGDDGRWSIIRGKSVSHTGKKIKESDIHNIADDLELSGHARNALLKAHRDGKIKTDEHLYRTIAASQDALDSSHSSQHHAIIAAAADLHGVGGAYEGKPWHDGGNTKPSAAHVEKRRDEVAASTHKVGDKVTLPAGHRVGAGTLRQDTPAKIETVEHGDGGIFHRVRYRDKTGRDKTTYLSARDLKDAAGRGYAQGREVGAKSDDEETDFADAFKTEQLTDLESSLPDGLDFGSHSLKVLAAVEELQERIELLADLRCVKSNRRWSAEKYARLTGLAGGLSAVADEVKAIANAHAPHSEAAAAPLAADALEALARIELTRARLNGIAL